MPDSENSGTPHSVPAGVELLPAETDREAAPSASSSSLEGDSESPGTPSTARPSPGPEGAEVQDETSLSCEGRPVERPERTVDGSTGGETSLRREWRRLGGADSTEGDGAVRENGHASVVDGRTEHHREDERAEAFGDRVVRSLIRGGRLDREAVETFLLGEDAEDDGELLWRRLACSSEFDDEMLFAEAASVYGFERIDLAKHPPDLDRIRAEMSDLPEPYEEHLFDLEVMPYRPLGEEITFGRRRVFLTRDPTRSVVSETLREAGVRPFELRYVPATELRTLIESVQSHENEYLDRLDEDDAYDLGAEIEEDEDELVDEDELEAEIGRSRLINLFEGALVEAVREGASDLHVYAESSDRVRFDLRIDGRLEQWHLEDRTTAESVFSVVKDRVEAADRFERAAAQDGYMQREIDGREIRFRVSVLPLARVGGQDRPESVVIRVLDDRRAITDVDELGFLPAAQERLERAIGEPHGMVILTGPTGSGKSTTQVAALHEVMTPEVNVLTVEDPVEYLIPGARQIRLSERLQLEDALRAILRHDPDVVMVGEMRDRITADLAIKLANTGHLTFSTLHTNDAPSAISRLYKMGIEPFLLAYAINLVVAQRLVRTLCEECRRPGVEYDDLALEHLGFSDEQLESGSFFRAGEDPNCATCGGRGYHGRRAVAETLYFSDDIRHLILDAGEDIDEKAIRDVADDEGMRSLRAGTRALVARGLTSVEEMMRVTFSGDGHANTPAT